MFCTVYPLRRNGKKLPPDEVRAGGVKGWVEIGRFGHAPETHARLFAERPETEAHRHLNILLQLRFVKLEKVLDGMLITGHGEKARGDPYERQAWWIVPDHTRPPLRPRRDPDKTITEYQAPIMGLGYFGEE